MPIDSEVFGYEIVLMTQFWAVRQDDNSTTIK